MAGNAPASIPTVRDQLADIEADRRRNDLNATVVAGRVAAYQAGTTAPPPPADAPRSIEETTQLPRNRFVNRLVINAQPADLRPPGGVQVSAPTGDVYQPMHTRQLGAPQTAGVSYIPRSRSMPAPVPNNIPGGACARVKEERSIYLPNGTRTVLRQGDVLDDPGAISIADTQGVPLEACTADGKPWTVVTSNVTPPLPFTAKADSKVDAPKPGKVDVVKGDSDKG